MKAKAYLMDFWSQIRSAWQSVRMQTSGFTSIAVVAVLASVIAGIALQIQTSPRSKLENLQSHGPAHLSLTDWTAEFYTCPKDSLEGQCKRVLQKMSNGTYAVASEQLPLGSGRYVANQQFTTRPTHVKLSHKISEQDAQNITKNWSREKPVLALSGQPVCESEKCQNEDLVVPMNKLILGEKSWINLILRSLPMVNLVHNRCRLSWSRQVRLIKFLHRRAIINVVFSLNSDWLF